MKKRRPKKPRRAKSQSSIQQPLPPAPSPQSTRPRGLKKIFSSVERTIGIVAAIIAVCLFVYDILKQPDVNFQTDFSGASAMLPFEITNRSYLFDMRRVTLSCGVGVAAFQDLEGHIFVAQGVILDADASLDLIKATKTVNYPCDATPLMNAAVDGSLVMGALKTPPNVVKSALTLVTACIWIGIKYDTLFKGRRADPEIFEWIKTPSGHQWIKGILVRPGNPDPCADEPRGPFIKLRGPSKLPELKFDY